jgi:enolase
MPDICEHNFARFQHGRHPSTQYPPDILTLQIKFSKFNWKIQQSKSSEEQAKQCEGAMRRVRMSSTEEQHEEHEWTMWTNTTEEQRGKFHM